jgi:hypothetical protein
MDVDRLDYLPFLASTPGWPGQVMDVDRLDYLPFLASTPGWPGQLMDVDLLDDLPFLASTPAIDLPDWTDMLTPGVAVTDTDAPRPLKRLRGTTNCDVAAPPSE